jgi:hypothetical protein
MDTQAASIAGGGHAQRMDQRIELGHLPVVRVESGYKIAGIMLGLVGGLMALGSLGILYGEFTVWGLLTPFAWVGIAIFLGGVHLAIMRKEVRLDAESVAVRTRGLVGRKAWTEPLAAYRGVLLRSKWEAGGRNQQAYQVFLVELQHEDPKKTVEIFQSRSDKGWHATWREVSLRFRLLAMEETPEGVVGSLPEDLEKSVRDKVREGALAIAFDPSAPPPAGLAVQAAEGGLDIRVLQRNWRSSGLWGGVGAIVAVLGFLIVMVAWGLPGIVLAVVAGLCIVATVALFGGFMASQARLQVGREAVTASLMTPFGEKRKQVIETARINGVQIGAPKGQQSGLCLHILTDDGRVYVGTGLSRPALEWLRNCLLAAVARL